MESAKTSKYNLTEGSIVKKLLLVAFPIIGTQLMQMTYNLTDIFWLARVGSEAVAAVGSAGMYMWLSFGFLLIGRMGAEIGVSQFLGKGDKKGALSISQNAAVIALVLGTLFGITMIFFNKTLIGFFDFREAEVAANAARYLFFTGFTMPLFFVAAVATGTFNASGNSRTPFICNGIGQLMNIILDPIFIFTFGMGVEGAAIATVIAHLFSCGSLLGALFLAKNRPFEKYSFLFHPDPMKIKLILRWSIPIGLESILFCFLSMMTTRLEASFGADAIAVSRIGVQIESLSWLIGGGFGSAVIAFIGQNYGAKKYDRVQKGTKIAMTLMSVWGTMITFILIFLGETLFSLFLPVPKLIALGKQYLFIIAFSQLSMNLESVASGAFKGKGKTIPPSIVSIVCNVLRPIMAYFLSRTSLGLSGIWIAISITTVMRGLWICLWHLFTSSSYNKAPNQGGTQ